MKKNNFLRLPEDVTHGRGYVYSLQYHIVWCTKYRKRLFVSGLEEEVKEHLRETAGDLQADIIAMEVMPDHIHLLLNCKPQFRPSDAIKIFKGNTARWMFLAHPELKDQLWGGHMWNPSYFIATVSDRSLEQVERYIREQKTE
ncbi:MAG: IS200/IS605 family transposase [Clostridia bacterium]|nr:IS200/IS605 family transposase [Clostridia bacterium]